jgi:hypothetical protein
MKFLNKRYITDEKSKFIIVKDIVYNRITIVIILLADFPKFSGTVGELALDPTIKMLYVKERKFLCPHRSSSSATTG